MPEAEHKKHIRVYFLASGDISLPIFEKLCSSSRVELVGAGTQIKHTLAPDGSVRTTKTPLLKECQKTGKAIDQLNSVNTEDFHSRLRDLEVDLLVVASFGQLLKPALLAIPPFGCLNIHASLLPKYRGASPIVACLLNGDTKTGVSFMQMEAGLDTGPVYRTCELDILENDTADKLEKRLGELAAANIEQVIEDIVVGGLTPKPQSQEGASYAKKIQKEDGFADWHESAELLANKARAYNPWPSLKIKIPTQSGGYRNVKITSAQALPDCPNGSTPGEILAFGKDGILVACGSGALRILRITPEGRNDMAATAYLLGAPLPSDQPFMKQFSPGD